MFAYQLSVLGNVNLSDASSDRIIIIIDVKDGWGNKPETNLGLLNIKSTLLPLPPSLSNTPFSDKKNL